MTTCSLRVCLVGSLVLSACSCCLEVELLLVTERHCRSIRTIGAALDLFKDSIRNQCLDAGALLNREYTPILGPCSNGKIRKVYFF